MLNKIIVMGRITKELELRKTQNGVSVLTFTIACDRDFQKGETDFIEVVAWRNTAEFVDQYFGKGRMIVVEGSLQSRKWEDKDGNKRTSWEVQASNCYFADSKTSEKSENIVNDDFNLIDDDSQLPF